ncbi:MerR family transcriptional regulator [Castellaniella sp.]|uniref:MerR family transcriptional regulator n=1 Tax=Castellaniella sp. TaxID=1955812 RepID=UPI00356592D3
MEKRDIDTLMADLGWGPDEWIPLEDMARACRLDVQWIIERIQDDVLQATYRDGRTYLTCATVWRAQKIERIERQFDADPQLAALMADLMEEIRSLRQQLKLAGR